MRLSALWFGLQYFWTSNQLILLPDKVREFVERETGSLDSLGMYRTAIDSVGATIVILTQLTVGFLSDHTESHLGRRRPYILYGVLTGLAGIILFMLAPGYWWLFASYMVIQFALNVASVPFQSLLPDLVPEQQHSKAGALMGLNHLLGNLVALLVLIGMSLVFGDNMDRGLLAFLLPSYIVVLVLTMFVVYFGVDEHGWMQGARRVVDKGVRTLRLLPGTVVRYEAQGSTLISTIVRDYLAIDLKLYPNFRALALSRFAIYFGYSTFLDWVNYYTKVNLDTQAWLNSIGQPNLPEALVLPCMLLFFLIGGIIGNTLSAPLSERYGKKGVIVAGAVLAVALFVPLIVTNSVWVAVGSGFLLGIGWGAFVAADWSFACTVMPKAMAGSFMGIWTITGLLPQSLGPLVSGPLRDIVYNGWKLELGELRAEALAHQAIFSLVIVYFVIGLIMLRKVREERRVPA